MLDLYLGGDLGLWALKQVPSLSVSKVFTIDKEIALLSQSLGFQCFLENPNLINFSVSEAAISVHYPRIFKPSLIEKYRKIYNLHPAYLPWGRGYYPIFWALWEDTPAGATLHEINEGIDQGNIIDQIQVEYYEYDTGGTLFNRVREAEKKLFTDYCTKIIEGVNLPSYRQEGTGTYHTKKDFLELKRGMSWQNMNGKDLIKLIRCLSFDGYPGLEIELQGRLFEISLRSLLNSD